MAGYPKRTGRIRQVREFARRGGAVLESGPVRPRARKTSWLPDWWANPGGAKGGSPMAGSRGCRMLTVLTRRCLRSWIVLRPKTA